MATAKQTTAARRNIKKPHAACNGMKKRQHTLAQPLGRRRPRRGGGGGEFYRIEVRPKSEFVSFRTQDIGKRKGLERIAGRRSSGSWATATWLVEKKAAHMDKKGLLVIDDPKVKTLLKNIHGPIEHVKADVFAAYPRRNVPEREKPTPAMRRAQTRNIKKAQAAHRKQK